MQIYEILYNLAVSSHDYNDLILRKRNVKPDWKMLIVAD